MKSITFFLSIFLLLTIENCNVKDALDKIFTDVSGNVSDNGQPVAGALVLLLTSASIADGVALSNFSITNASGDYTIIDVDNGNYYVVAIDDINDNLQYDEGIDRFGFHGVDLTGLDILPDQISVSDADVDGIDVTYLTSL